MAKVKTVPEGMHSLTPHIVCDGVAAAIEFYKKAFAAVEEVRLPAPTGKIMGEIYKLATGIKAVEVSYKTAPDSLNELTSGKLDYGMHDPVFSLAQQREGRLRILGISTGQRLKATGDAPTMSEQGVKMDLTGWWGAMVPTGTPEPVIQQINQWFTFIAQTDETTKFLNSFGGDVWVSSHAEAQKYFVQQIAAWREFVKLAKIEPQ